MNAKRFATSFCLPKAIPKKSKDKRNMKRVFSFLTDGVFHDNLSISNGPKSSRPPAAVGRRLGQ